MRRLSLLLTLLIPCSLFAQVKTFPVATEGDSAGIGFLVFNANSSGTNNVAVGYRALQKNTTGNHNTAIGYMAMEKNTQGTFNVAVGDYALADGTTNSQNVGVGDSALGAVASGSNNIALGGDTGYNLVTGSRNMFMGHRSGNYYNNASDSYFFGYRAGANETASARFHVGYMDTRKPFIYGEMDVGKVVVDRIEALQIRAVTLATPSAPTVTPAGANNGATWGYKVEAVSCDGLGHSIASAEGTTNVGASTLTSTDKNVLTWTAVAGACGYRVYRTTSGGTPASTGYIETTLPFQSKIDGAATTDPTYPDGGAAASAPTPATVANVGNINIAGLQAFANNAAAAAGGLAAGDLYMVTGSDPRQIAIVY